MSPRGTIRADLGEFSLGELLGEGGMGRVYAAVHLPTREPVAVKVLRRRVDGLALQREVDAVGRLDHPNVVRVWEAGTVAPGDGAVGSGIAEAGAPWLAFELATGGTLLRDPAELGWEGLKAAIVDVLAALAHAHAHGVLHRDVKPSNVLRTSPGGPWALADFGIARLRDHDAIRAVSGTLGFMPPEQRNPSWRREGPHTDLWAVGAVVFALCSGRPPDDDPIVPRLPVPAGLRSWLATMLAREPADRPTHAADALAALRDLGPPVGASAPLVVLEEATTSALLDTDPDEPVWTTAERPPPAPRGPPPAPLVRAPPPGSLGLALVVRRPASAPEIAHARDRTWALLDLPGPSRLLVTGPPESGRGAWLLAVTRELVGAGAVHGFDLRPRAAPLGQQVPAWADERPGAGPWRAVLANPAATAVERRAAEVQGVACCAADRPVLVLTTAADAPTWWAARADLGNVVIAWVGPEAAAELVVRTGLAHDAEIEALLQARLPLSPDAVAWILARSAGLPGRALDRLDRLSREGALVPGPAGFDVAPRAGVEPRPPPGVGLLAMAGDRVSVASAREVGRGAGGVDPDGAALWLVREGQARWEANTLVFPGLAVRQRLVEVDPPPPGTAEAWWSELGAEAGPESRVRAGRLDLVEADLTIHRARDSGTRQVWLALLEVVGEGAALASAWRASIAVDRGDLQAAEELLADESAASPLVDARRAVARAELWRARGTGDVERLVRHALAGFELAGASAMATGCRLWLGELVQTRDWREALDQWDRIAADPSNDPGVRRVAVRKAAVLRAAADGAVGDLAGQLEDAVAEALRAGALLDALQALNALATVHRVRGEPAARLDVLTRGARLATGLPESRSILALNLGTAHLEAGHTEQAREAWRLAVRTSPREDVRELATFGLACCALLVDGDPSGVRSIPEHPIAAAMALQVWSALDPGRRAVLRPVLAGMAGSMADRELSARLAAALSAEP